ncbi:hypothetical protein J3P95_13775 [Pseudomonas sp. Z5-35]|uniref:Uncharacterized protein n=1 Tax=Pseudomonas marvdashtae TaxID=2745500 RepID=A0A923FMW8_9PSED|nr:MULTISPECIES: hypothetical protein [Pseudomonas]MBC3375840.1 hypothetical protein [Pseudomonas sp. SWRI92]MBV4552234.1 hypothetical protein [Pseudomonas marvdashtae]
MDCRVFTPLFLILPLWVQAAEPVNEGCINVEVNGYKALSYECLSEQMANPKGTAAARKNQEAMNVPIDQRAPNKLGLYNQSATRIRMGNTFGNSALPQRPPQ